MLPKHQRLSREEIEEVKKKNKKILQGEFFGLVFQKEATINSKQKFGVIVSNSISKKATVRNKIKRLLYLAIQTSPFISPGKYLFLAKRTSLGLNQKNANEEIKRLNKLVK